MNSRILFCILLSVLLNATNAFGQTLKVIDETTLQPVANVYVYNDGKDKMAATDGRGRVDLSRFSQKDTLNFQHPSFKNLRLSYSDIAAQDFVVKLVERAVMMEEVFVSASKREQNQTEIPQKITQIGNEQIRFYNPQTSADLLQNSGKIFVQKSQQGGGSPMIRGFAANSVLIAVDGIRMNNAIFRSGNLQNVINIDANTLKNTEVLFGPGSIIYGSDALGGVMNFQTKDPALSFSESSVNTEVNAMGRYASADNERTFHADANVGFDKWGFLTSVTYSNFDDLRSGADFYDEYPDFGKREEYVVRRNGTDTVVENDDVTVQRFSGYEQLNLMQKIRFDPSSEWKADYGFHFSTTGDIPRYDRLIEREQGDTGQFVNAEWYYGPQIWMLNTLELHYTSESALFDVANAILSHQWFQESRNDRKFGSVELRNREENVDVYQLNLDFDKYWDEDKELFYGLEGVYNYVSSEATARNIETGAQSDISTRYPDGGSDYLQLAAYTKYEQELSSQVTAIAGLRYSHVMLNSRFESKQFYDFPYDEIELSTGALNANIGFTYRPAANLQFNLNGSSGFRAPNVDDVAKVFDSEPGTVIVPNSNLSPEYSYNLDFSVIKRFDEVVRIELNTYYTWLKDAMVRRDFTFSGQDSIMYDGTLSNVEALVNAGKAYIYGASFALTAELSNHLAFESDVTYTNGRDISNNEPLRHVAPAFGRAGFVYKAEKTKIEAYTEFNAHKDISYFSPSERNKPHLYTEDGSPGWATLNLATSYQVNEQIQLNAGVENILDKHYRPYSSGISAPGRNISVALRATL